jgi:predicted nucleotidyltransferase
MPSLEPSHLQLTVSQRQLLCTLLQTHVPHAQVWAYGSRVFGGGHEGSDLDLVLRNPAQLTAPCAGHVALQEALQTSALPMLVDVHDWAQLPADFHRNIERGYVQLQVGTPP